MSLQQRRALRNCFIQNRDRAQHNRNLYDIEQFREICERDPINDPNWWHEILKEMPEPERTQFLKLIMERTPKEIFKLAQQFFNSLDTDVEYWECMIRECIGIELENDTP